ncbi:four-carbon acid sugar kinase family protein [Pedobacter heparinus]|uniref:Four-carbon acid sugar kinase N-terminal domain-containing protein n=1 Tax=Pedobacter heparinus (strain ATCC 13125 / DSM 2366 / CIP 104194 / JCM 7457 / NBRC 12017 / NCIMB 9290 / NRRL B-14731 / HIM 762-3) TaxID=485917 RepID=C6Y0I7_PEDHD|nr:four-carbon acid sugar kinase family protein [Pedobacter heparinus]ACU02748.1 conserved hypothetical protein [Pedobacter heparinus DSM 2366]
MIAVIADDFTGAAEIGGIALRQGWNAIIDTRVQKGTETDILIIATNTRSKPPQEARKTIRELTLQLLSLSPEIIYKKIDSVLRGNVGEELLEQMAVSQKRRALLIPANPSLKRVIKDGIYYYEGLPLKDSTFARNVKHQIGSSRVIDLMGDGAGKDTVVISRAELMPDKGLIIGNTTDEADLDHWAGRVDEETIMAGGSSFFNALLRKIKVHPYTDPAGFAFGKKVIYVCGSAFPLSRSVVEDARQAGQYVSYMPSRMFCKPAEKSAYMAHWEREILKGVQQSGTVIVAINVIEEPRVENLSSELGKTIATVIANVMQGVQLEELVIEGGATASAIIEKLEYRKFHPTQELAPGVIRMKVEENKSLHLTMKPGSYTWPSSIWKYSHKP